MLSEALQLDADFIVAHLNLEALRQLLLQDLDVHFDMQYFYLCPGEAVKFPIASAPPGVRRAVLSLVTERRMLDNIKTKKCQVHFRNFDGRCALETPCDALRLAFFSALAKRSLRGTLSFLSEVSLEFREILRQDVNDRQARVALLRATRITRVLQVLRCR